MFFYFIDGGSARKQFTSINTLHSNFPDHFEYFAYKTASVELPSLGPTLGPTIESFSSEMSCSKYKINPGVCRVGKRLTLAAREPCLYVRICRLQILTYKDGPCAERIKLFLMVVHP